MINLRRRCLSSSPRSNATHPKALANMAKHSAFTRCGEVNLYGIVDAQIAVLEDELFAGNTRAA